MMAAEALSRRQPHKATRLAVAAKETRAAFQWAIDSWRQRGNEGPSLAEILWLLMEDAVRQSLTWKEDNVSRLPSAWPELARPSEENRQIEDQIKNEIYVLRIRMPDTWFPRRSVAKPNEDRALRVLSWLQYIGAKSEYIRRRDVKTVIDLAAGVPVRVVRAKYYKQDASESSVRMAKQKAMKHIAEALIKKGLAN